LVRGFVLRTLRKYFLKGVYYYTMAKTANITMDDLLNEEVAQQLASGEVVEGKVLSVKKHEIGSTWALTVSVWYHVAKLASFVT